MMHDVAKKLFHDLTAMHIKLLVAGCFWCTPNVAIFVGNVS